MKRTIIAGCILVLALASLFAADDQKASVLFQAAQAKETIQGDLKGAIELYQNVVKEAGVNRALAVQALAREADCYQKLGDSESQKIYERIVREFADQKEAVAMARSHLDGGTAHSAGVVTRQAWTLPSDCGCDVFGNISPDGRYIAYIDWAVKTDLFLHDLSTGANRRLTNGGGEGEPGAEYQVYSFSRDSKQLAYTWLPHGSSPIELRVVGLQASGVPAFRTLFANADVGWVAPYDWSPDGKWVAVGVRRSDRTAQLGLVSTQDGSLRVLKSADWRLPSKMFFSPDGKHLAFDLPADPSLDATGERDVFILATDGSREIPAVVHPSDDMLIGWSPDGTRLLFASDRTGSTGLWALRFTDGEVHGAPDLIKRDLPDMYHLHVMGMTTSGAFYSDIDNGKGQDIALASFDFTQGRFLSSPLLAVQTFEGTNRQPDWSPDGKYLAYLTRDRIVGIRAVATGQVRELSLSGSMFYIDGFRWASDSASFLVAATDAKGRRGLFRVDAQNGRSAVVVLEDRSPDLSVAAGGVESSDGQFLYYNRYDLLHAPPSHSFTIVKRNLASGTSDDLVRRANLGGVMVSPDGRYIATAEVDRAANSTSVLLIPTGGGEPRELIHNGGNPVMWAPDSQSVLVRRGQELWRAPLDGGQPTKLDVTLDPDMGAFRVHPDGRQVAIQMRSPTKPEEVWVLENFLPPANAKK